MRVLPAGDRWVRLGRHWMRVHTVPCNTAYTPQLEEDGPDLSMLLDVRITFKSYDRGHVDTITDEWKSGVPDEEQCSWTGTTTFLTVDLPPHLESEVQSEGETPEHARQRLVDMSSSRPWDGDETPMSIYDDPASFVRRDGGVWCRKDVRGRLYPVNVIGQRCAKPKTFETSEGHCSDQKRPADMSHHVWWKMTTKSERLQWWIDHLGGALVVSMKHDFTCNPVGISSLVSKAAGSLVQTWKRHFLCV